MIEYFTRTYNNSLDFIGTTAYFDMDSDKIYNNLIKYVLKNEEKWMTDSPYSGEIFFNDIKLQLKLNLIYLRLTKK